MSLWLTSKKGGNIQDRLLKSRRHLLNCSNADVLTFRHQYMKKLLTYWMSLFIVVIFQPNNNCGIQEEAQSNEAANGCPLRQLSIAILPLADVNKHLLIRSVNSSRSFTWLNNIRCHQMESNALCLSLIKTMKSIRFTAIRLGQLLRFAS